MRYYLMQSGVPDAGRVEIERWEMEGGRDMLMSGFRLKIGLTPNSPSRARNKRELIKTHITIFAC